jgi:hypothetical protein
MALPGLKVVILELKVLKASRVLKVVRVLKVSRVLPVQIRV